MSDLFATVIAWCGHNQAIVGVVIGLAGLFIGMKKNVILNSIRMAGFNFGQLLVHTLGKKAEDAVKQAVDAFEDGLDSDEKTTITTATATATKTTITTENKSIPASQLPDVGVKSNNDIVG